MYRCLHEVLYFLNIVGIFIRGGLIHSCDSRIGLAARTASQW